MRILVVFPVFPEPDRASGHLRMFEILRILVGRGHRVTFLAQTEGDTRYREAVEALGIECVSDVGRRLTGYSARFRTLLQERAFHIAILPFYYVYNTYAPYIRAFLPDCRLILDTVDLHFVRIRRQAELAGGSRVVEAPSRVAEDEGRAILDADIVWVVTEVESELASQTFGSHLRVRVVPNVHRSSETVPGYEQRDGIVFLGGYRHSANLDAVNYFLRSILPLVRNELSSVPVLIAGSNPPPELCRHAETNAGVRVTGFVPDHRALLTQCRVGIAPLRFGAGMKGKIGEYLACGLPTVTTSVGAEGMHLRHSQEALIADNPAEFAEAVVQLYRDPDLWNQLSAAGPRHIEQRLSPDAVAVLLQNGLAPAPGAERAHTRRRPSRRLRIFISPRKLGGFCSRSIGRLFVGLRNPRKVLRLLMRSADALRKGGASELRARLAVWASRARA